MWDRLGEADRSLRTDTRDDDEVWVLVLEKDYPAPLDDVWHAVTTGERISRWLGPVSGDLELGGRYQIEGNAGGTVLRCEPPRLLEVTWEFGGGLGWVEVTLAEAGTGTRLRLEHSASVDDDTRRQYGPGALGIGWELGLGGLGLNLVDPSEPSGEPDYGDPGYPAYVRRVGAAWMDADVAAGAGPEEARAAAERCIAAYTAPPADPPAEPTQGG